MGYWEARAVYEDGTEICEKFPYRENDNYTKENLRQSELEEWLIEQHDECKWYSVNYVSDDNEE